MKTTVVRNPKGVTKEKPIALRLMPEELSNANLLAEKAGLSKSAFARQAYLAGLPLVTESMLPISSGTSCGSDDSDSALLHQHIHA